MIQPIVVRELAGGKYEIIAGERRWRAAQQAELRDVPVVVRDVDDRSVIAMALIENIQREDLNPLEEAISLHRLIDEFSLTHQQAAEAVGRSRAAVSNLLRLLELPEAIRALLEARQLEMGHARALLTLPRQSGHRTGPAAASEQLSVREVERRAQQAGTKQDRPRSRRQPAPSRCRHRHAGTGTLRASRRQGAGAARPRRQRQAGHPLPRPGYAGRHTGKTSPLSRLRYNIRIDSAR